MGEMKPSSNKNEPQEKARSVF